MDISTLQERSDINALANSSFQTASSDNGSNNDEEYSINQEAQLNYGENNNIINTAIHQKTPTIQDEDGDLPMLEYQINNIDHDNTNKSVIDTNNLTTNNSLSVIGLEPINSPRKAMQDLFDIPINKTPRLVIEKLVLTNFKSYAGRQEIGPFHASFSAVVGPNGSGKSNVIDSLLFVFGFRASKMRQSKLKELIHNSENFPSIEFCQLAPMIL